MSSFKEVLDKLNNITYDDPDCILHERINTIMLMDNNKEIVDEYSVFTKKIIGECLSSTAKADDIKEFILSEKSIELVKQTKLMIEDYSMYEDKSYWTMILLFQSFLDLYDALKTINEDGENVDFLMLVFENVKNFQYVITELKSCSNYVSKWLQSVKNK